MTGSRSILLLFILLISPTLLPAQQVEKIDWIYEINLLGKELSQKHKDLYFKTDSVTFHTALDQIAKEAEGKSLFRVSIQLQQALARMVDAQTRINYHFNINADAILPVELYWFEEGIYVLKTRMDFKEILGKKLTSINGFPVSHIIDSLATLIVNNNDALLRAEIPKMIVWTQVLENFGFADSDSLDLEVENPDGSRITQAFLLPAKESESVSIQPEELPLGWRDRKSFFHDIYLPDEKIYYIQYNKCWSREAEEKYGTGASALFMPSLKEFEKQMFHTIKSNEIDKVVFDMRFNGGGNALQGTRLIRKLAKTKFRGGGYFYVLVGRNTSSSAIINTVDFINNAEVVIIGEETGGRPNHYGEVNRFVLPESRLVVSYSTEYFFLMEDNPSTITPEILAPISFQDYIMGRDPAMEAVISHKPVYLRR